MDSTKYVKKQLINFATKFTYFQFTYWYNADFSNHFIEIIPSSFQDNISFLDSELDFIDEFYLQFPAESLSFVTAQELSSISKVEKLYTIPIKLHEWFDEPKLNQTTFEPSPVCTKHDYSLAA